MTQEKNTHTEEWLLDGLDCAHCASKIETNVQKLEGVDTCNVNFMTQKLQVVLHPGADGAVLTNMKKEIQKADGGIKILSGNAHARNHLHSDGHDHDCEGHDHEESSGHSHGHAHDHGNVSKNEMKIMIVRLVSSLGILLLSRVLSLPPYGALGLALVAYLLAGYEVVTQAIRNTLNGQLFDENFLMTIATLSAFYIQQYPEAVAVMIFYQVGELFQDIAVQRSRRSIADLMDIRPDSANIKTVEGIKAVHPESVQVGDIILVRPGEKVPLDGVISKGQSSVDTSALTGESVPRSVYEGETILSGFVNQQGVLEIEVEKPFSESTVVKILELVENASSRKAPTENFISKFAHYYTPVVVVIAAIMAIFPPLLLQGATFNDWLYRASIFLVISCPCALVVSIPVGFFGGIGAASKKGILVKGGNFLEALNDVQTMVMDKTGTLTKGNFEVTEIVPASNWTTSEILELAAYSEAHSTHPIGTSIKKKYGKEVDETVLSEYKEIAGHGVEVCVDGKHVATGNKKLMDTFSISLPDIEETGTIVYVAVDNQFAGFIKIEDEIKEYAFEAIQNMKKQGIKRIVMLTGDADVVAQSVAKKVGIDEVYSELLPQDKVTRIEELLASQTGKGKVAFVGDGLNDTPVIARSDIGFAMGGIGSDAAIEAADVVIMEDDPQKIADSMQIAKDTRRIVWQNIYFAMGVKLLFLVLGAFGVATMWEAVFADVGVTVLAVLNAMRVMKK